jgi:uncharacterized membrane protein
MNKTVLNERLKLLAGWFNTVAAAFVTTGVVAPAIAVIYGLAPKALDRPLLVILSSIICIVTSGGLHLAGRFILGALEE